MPRGIAANPTTDKRRLPRPKTGGRQKTGKIHKSYWAYPYEHDELARRLAELRAGGEQERKRTP